MKLYDFLVKGYKTTIASIFEHFTMDLNKTHAVDPPEIITERAFLLYWNQQYDDLYFPNTIVLAFFLAIGIPGNIIVIIVYQFCLHKRKGGLLHNSTGLLGPFCIDNYHRFKSDQKYSSSYFPGYCKL